MRNIDEAIKLITQFEGFRPKPYLDALKIPTIGYGTTRYPDGRKVTMRDPPISEEYGKECLKFHVKDDCELLESFLISKKIKLTDRQFSSLVCFSYNCGCGPVVTQGKGINLALQTPSFKGIDKALMAYTKGTLNGKRIELPGLVRRRKAELALFLS